MIRLRARVNKLQAGVIEGLVRLMARAIEMGITTAVFIVMVWVTLRIRVRVRVRVRVTIGCEGVAVYSREGTC